MKTKRVRIAVVINADAKVECCLVLHGDKDAADLVIDWLGEEPNCDTVHFIEADLPIPEAMSSQTIEGKVVP